MYVQRKRKKKTHGGTNILLKCLVVRPTRTYKCQTPIQLTSWTWDMNCMYEISFLAREHSPKLFLVWEYPVFFLKLLEVCVHVLLSDPMSSVGQPRPAVNVLAEKDMHRRKHVWLKFWNYVVRRPIQRAHPSACTTDETPISFSVVVVSLSKRAATFFKVCTCLEREVILVEIHCEEHFRTFHILLLAVLDCFVFFLCCWFNRDKHHSFYY